MPGSVRRAVTVIGAAVAIYAIAASAHRSDPAARGVSMLPGFASPVARVRHHAEAIATLTALPKANAALVADALRSAPLSPDAFYVHAMTASDGRASAAIDQALLRNPRYAPGYRWRIAEAARRGDIRALTASLIRLAQIDRGSGVLQGLVAVSADPRARALIMPEIAANVPWASNYLSILSTSSIDRGAVFALLQASGRPAAAGPSSALGNPGPRDRPAFLAAMVARKDYERAYLAWIQWLPAASQAGVSYVFDGDFKGLAALPPFAWKLMDGMGGAATVDPATGLSVDYSGDDDTAVAEQMVLLAPGRYRVVTLGTFPRAASGDEGPSPLHWTVTCISAPTPLVMLPVPRNGTPAQVASMPFDVPAGCAAQTLALRISPADFSQRVAGTVRAVAIEAVS